MQDFAEGEDRMTDRKEKLLRLLESQNSWITGKELSQILKVSDRTIRSDIDAMNHEYEYPLIESNIRKGYRLIVDNYQRNKKPENALIPQTPKERSTFILKKLLLTNQKLSIIDLLDEIYISEYALDNDLKNIKEFIDTFEGMKITKSRNHLYLEGPEHSIRELYKQMLLEETQKNFLNIDEIASIYKNFDLLKCKLELEKILKKYSYEVHDVSFPSLIVHVGISIDRIFNFRYVESMRNTEEIMTSIEYRIAKEFYERIAALYQTEIVESEIVMLAFLLMGKKGTNFSSESLKEFLPENVTCNMLAQEMLDNILKNFGINFTEDEGLIVGLTLHLQSLIERAAKNLVANNLYLQEIKRKYPLIFELGVSCANYLSRRLDLEVSEEEIGFIALHLGMAYERQNAKHKYKAIVIFPTTQAISNAPILRMQRIFSEYMDIIGIFNYYEETKILELKPDLLICSVPLKHSLDIPTVQISIFFSREDESYILSALNALEQKHLKAAYADCLNEMFRPEHFFTDMEFKTSEEVIKFMCDDLYKSGAVSDQFFDSVMARESMSSTSFIHQFAIPHALDSTVYQSNISVVILRKPIRWGPYDVKIVFLLAAANTESVAMQLFFEWMINLSNDVYKMTSLMECSNYNEFIKYFD